MAARASSGDCYSKFYNARDKFAEDFRFVPIRLVLAIAGETVLAVGRPSPLAALTGCSRARPLRLPTNTFYHPEKLLGGDGDDDDSPPH